MKSYASLLLGLALNTCCTPVHVITHITRRAQSSHSSIHNPVINLELVQTIRGIVPTHTPLTSELIQKTTPKLISNLQKIAHTNEHPERTTCLSLIAHLRHYQEALAFYVQHNDDNKYQREINGINDTLNALGNTLAILTQEPHWKKPLAEALLLSNQDTTLEEKF